MISNHILILKCYPLISWRILTYPFISYHILRYPRGRTPRWYLKPMRYFSSALSGPAPVPPALLHASSSRPGSANPPRQRLTAHAPAWPAAVPLHRSTAAFAPPETIAVCGQVICRLPAPSLPARPTSSLKRPDPRQSKQGLL
jgi:hypothetical protein